MIKYLIDSPELGYEIAESKAEMLEFVNASLDCGDALKDIYVYKIDKLTQLKFTVTEKQITYKEKVAKVKN